MLVVVLMLQVHRNKAPSRSTPAYSLRFPLHQWVSTPPSSYSADPLLLLGARAAFRLITDSVCRAVLAPSPQTAQYASNMPTVWIPTRSTRSGTAKSEFPLWSARVREADCRH